MATATAQAPAQANKIITVFGNGSKDNRGRKLVINKRTAPSYDRVLDMLSKLMELPGGVRKLYTLPDCKLIKSVEMLSGCTSTDFVAVGNTALDRSKLHTLGASGRGGSASSAGRASNSNSAKGKGKGKAASSTGTPRGSATSRNSYDLNKHKQLPGIVPAADTGTEDRRGGSGSINKANPLPGIDGGGAHEDELQSSTKLQPVGDMMLDGDHRPAGNADYVATELINAAGQADKALDEERDRQRRAHEERMATRQHARETEQTRKLETYAEGAERVDTTIDEERARQKKEFQRKLSQRKRTSTTHGSGGGSGAPASLKETEEKAATTIQAAYRGHAARKNMPQIRKQAKKETKPKGKKKKKKSKVKGGKGQPSPPPAEKPAAAAEAEAAASPETPASPGETQATKLERQTSRFSTKGIEERSKVEESYDIGKKIGDGNFAVVKECTKRETGEKFALKIIDKSKTRGAKETKMIENEVHTMRSVRHPNCVGLYDVYDTKEELFLVMELVSGGDLFDRIVEKGKYQESDAVRLVRNMATAINHMHEQNIIHRDLKPENLLVTQDAMGRDTLKLADFGLSMVVKEPVHTICGTPTYVAPEIISESPEGYGLQVDLWATGVIAYIMLCGFPPFASQSKNQKDLFRKIKAGKFSFPMPYWKGISEDAKDLISNLLKVNPDERFTAKQLLAHPWIANIEEDATNL